MDKLKTLLLFSILISVSSYGGDCFTDSDFNDCKQKALLYQDSNAQNELGTMFYTGRGAAQDFVEALKWFRAAANQGNVASQLNLGHMYDVGEGVSQNYPQALKWFKEAADQGDTFAEEQVKDVEEKIARMQESNDADELFNLAEGYYSLGREGVYRGGDREEALRTREEALRNYEEAIKWFIKSAEQGHSGAMNRLIQFDMGIVGEGIALDSDTYYSIGNIEADKDNVSAAVGWYEKAAKQGHSDAQFRVGYYYENREDEGQSDTLALKWYRLATEQGHTIAPKRIQIIEEKMAKIQQAAITAREAQRLENNEEKALTTLGQLYFSYIVGQELCVAYGIFDSDQESNMKEMMVSIQDYMLQLHPSIEERLDVLWDEQANSTLLQQLLQQAEMGVMTQESADSYCLQIYNGFYSSYALMDNNEDTKKNTIKKDF